MPSEEEMERKKRKEEKIQKLRLKQEDALKKIDEMEKHEIFPEELTKKGYKTSMEELSKGQFSTIFKGKHNDEDIVIKIIEKENKEEKFLKIYLPRHVIIMRTLNGRHDSIINTLDVFETSKRVLILMSLAPNGSLNDLIDKTTDPLDENETRKWAQELMSGLCYLHVNGIVHRDLRTDQILLTKDNCLKISGLTQSRLWINPKDNSVVKSMKTIGSMAYCSPESLTGEGFDPRTADVWSYGVIVFYIWNKSYPFDYNHMQTLLAQQRNNEWNQRMRKDSNDLIKGFFQKIFDLNVSQRQTIVALLEDKWVDCKLTVAGNGNTEDKDHKTTKVIKESTDNKTNETKVEIKSIPESESKNNDKISDKVKPKDESKNVDKKEATEDDSDDQDVEGVSDDESDEDIGAKKESKEEVKSKSNSNEPQMKPKAENKVDKQDIKSNDKKVLKTTKSAQKSKTKNKKMNKNSKTKSDEEGVKQTNPKNAAKVDVKNDKNGVKPKDSEEKVNENEKKDKLKSKDDNEDKNEEKSAENLNEKKDDVKEKDDKQDVEKKLESKSVDKEKEESDEKKKSGNESKSDRKVIKADILETL